MNASEIYLKQILDNIEAGTLQIEGNVDVNTALLAFLADRLTYAQLKGYRSSDGTYQPLRLDRATNSLQTIDYEHHEVHAGSHFYYTDKVELASTATQVYLITVPDSAKYPHVTFAATGSAITQVDLYEAANRAGTTLQTVRNSNRNFADNLATMTVHKDVSGGSTDGTLIWTMKSGAASAQSRAGMASNRSNELVLKRNTKYLLRITSATNNNLTNLQLEWYEHTDIS